MILPRCKKETPASSSVSRVRALIPKDQGTAFYILNGIIPVSGGSFGANLGATFWSKDTLSGVKKDKEGFRSLKKTMKNFSFLLRKQTLLKTENEI